MSLDELVREEEVEVTHSILKFQERYDEGAIEEIIDLDKGLIKVKFPDHLKIDKDKKITVSEETEIKLHQLQIELLTKERDSIEFEEIKNEMWWILYEYAKSIIQKSIRKSNEYASNKLFYLEKDDLDSLTISCVNKVFEKHYSLNKTNFIKSSFGTMLDFKRREEMLGEQKKFEDSQFSLDFEVKNSKGDRGLKFVDLFVTNNKPSYKETYTNLKIIKDSIINSFEYFFSELDYIPEISKEFKLLFKVFVTIKFNPPKNGNYDLIFSDIFNIPETKINAYEETFNKLLIIVKEDILLEGFKVDE